MIPSFVLGTIKRSSSAGLFLFFINCLPVAGGMTQRVQHNKSLGQTAVAFGPLSRRRVPTVEMHRSRNSPARFELPMEVE
jgi:hypothetical protein